MDNADGVGRWGVGGGGATLHSLKHFLTPNNCTSRFETMTNTIFIHYLNKSIVLTEHVVLCFIRPLQLTQVFPCKAYILDLLY